MRAFDHLPGMAAFLARYFPGVYAELIGSDFETAKAILLHRFGVMLPAALCGLDDCVQYQACLRKMEAAARTEGLR